MIEFEDADGDACQGSVVRGKYLLECVSRDDGNVCYHPMLLDRETALLLAAHLLTFAVEAGSSS